MLWAEQLEETCHEYRGLTETHLCCGMSYGTFAAAFEPLRRCMTRRPETQVELPEGGGFWTDL